MDYDCNSNLAMVLCFLLWFIRESGEVAHQIVLRHKKVSVMKMDDEPDECPNCGLVDWTGDTNEFGDCVIRCCNCGHSICVWDGGDDRNEIW